jgi:hypothetical protein
MTPGMGRLAVCEEGDKELVLWDVRTAAKVVAVTRSEGIWTSRLAPDGTTFAVAAKDGLSVHRLTPRGGSAKPSEPLWEALSGTSFLDVAFSRDSALVASVQDSGLVEVMMSQADRSNPEYFPPYLEVLRANEPPEVVWSGVSGQISKLDTAVCQRDKKMSAEVVGVQKQVTGVEEEIEELSKKVSKTEDKVDKVCEALPTLEGKIDALSKARDEMDRKLLLELAEIKALLIGKEHEQGRDNPEQP